MTASLDAFAADGIVTAITLAGLIYLVNQTRLGRAMRATAENPRVAALMADYPSCEQSGFFSIIRSAKIWDIGNGDSTSFTAIPNGTTQQGNALKVSLTTDTNHFIIYYFAITTTFFLTVIGIVHAHRFFHQFNFSL